jgi:hypothetical protein
MNVEDPVVLQELVNATAATLISLVDDHDRRRP